MFRSFFNIYVIITTYTWFTQGYFPFPAQLFVFCMLSYCLCVCLLTSFSIYFSLTQPQTLCLLSEFALNPLSHIRYSVQFIFFEEDFPECSDPFHQDWLPSGTQILGFPSVLSSVGSPVSWSHVFLFSTYSFILVMNPPQVNFLVLAYLKISGFPLPTWNDFPSCVPLSPHFQYSYLGVQGHPDSWFFESNFSLSF